MSQTTQERNKAFVLQAFDTLFNKRNYEAAERYWSPTIFSIARISPLAVKAFSISSREFRRP
jgi:hypothetical protein